MDESARAAALPGVTTECPWYEDVDGARVMVHGREHLPWVKTYRMMLDEYRFHPEGKSAGDDGTPCEKDTRGAAAGAARHHRRNPFSHR